MPIRANMTVKQPNSNLKRYVYSVCSRLDLNLALGNVNCGNCFSCTKAHGGMHVK